MGITHYFEDFISGRRAVIMMDYIKAVEQINDQPNDSSMGMYIYEKTRLLLPDKLYKYYSITENEELNNKKFVTLLKKRYSLPNLNI